jgi:glycosyltransferase involved in cell wall biosynthesis
MHPVAAEKKREIRAKYQLPDHYILNVGSIEERKNALSAVQALTMLPEQIHLVIVGRHTEYTDKIERFIKENKLEERVHIISNVPFDDLPAFYQLAEIFVYPSRFEGFGIPIIEALYSGIPVVAATGSCLEEAGGPDSIYVHPDDIKGMANAFKQIYSDTERKKEMIEKGQKFAKRFSEEKQAEEILNIYKKLMK